jgi:hypothetical protein
METSKMKSNSDIELKNPDVYPNDEILKSLLGKSFEAYSSLLELFATNDIICEWRYYNDVKRWLCKVQHKKRTIVWMSASKGFIKATIYFPEKYIDDIYSLDITPKTKDYIKNTRNSGKSKPCIFEMKTSSVPKDFSKIMQLKLKTK